MVMWFNVKEAREQLLTKRYVVTLRPKKRREGKDILMYNGFGKKGDLYVIFLHKVENDGILAAYLSSSGFETVEAWRKAAGESKYAYVVYLGHVEEHKEPCACCNECMRVEDGRWIQNVAQWAYCNQKFKPSDYGMGISEAPEQAPIFLSQEETLRGKSHE